MWPVYTGFTDTYMEQIKLCMTLHCFSPLGEIFRARLRQFPALVNCCTIDWFSEWPADALRSVALKFLQDIPELDTTDEVMDGLVSRLRELTTLSGLQIYGGPGLLPHDFKIWPITFQGSGPVLLAVKKSHFNKNIHLTASLLTPQNRKYM